jgi:HSP20 family molecular chaperone IbpA
VRLNGAPERVQTDEIKAEFKNGVVEIAAPLEVVAKKIPLVETK